MPMRHVFHRLPVVALCLCLCLLCAVAGAESLGGDAFAGLYAAAYAIDYRPDGRLIFAVPADESHTVDAVLCLNAQGETLWRCDLPGAYENFGVALAEGADGQTMLLARSQADGWQVSAISAAGAYISATPLPDAASMPLLLPDGAVYPVSTGDGAALAMLDWQGNVTETPLAGIGGLNLYGAATQDGRTYVTAFYANEDDRRMWGILCLGEDGSLAWRHDLLPVDGWYMMRWTPNAQGGVTVPMQYMDDEASATTLLISLDGTGAEAWRKQLTGDVALPTIHYMEQGADGAYRIWGHGETASGTVTFKLTADADGALTDTQVKPVWGDCHPYIDGAVYAVLNPIDDPQLMPFDALPGEGSAAFALQ